MANGLSARRSDEVYTLTARDKICDDHSPPHVRLGLPLLKYEHPEKWNSDQRNMDCITCRRQAIPPPALTG